MSKQHLRSNALRALVTFLAVVFAIGVTAVGAQAKGGSKPAPLTIVSITPAPGTTVDGSAYDGTIDIMFNDIGLVPQWSIVDDSTGQNVAADSGDWLANQTGLAIHAKSSSCTPTLCNYGFEAGTTYTVTLGTAKRPVTTVSGAKLAASDAAGVTIKKGVATLTFTTAP